MPQTAEQTAIVKELYSRRDTLSPDKRAIVDELASRYGMTGTSPTLLASRQAASAGEFVQNQPESTVGTRTREALIGILQPFDLHNVPGLVDAIGGAVGDIVTGKGTARGQELVKGAITAPIEPVKQFAEGIQEGDYDKAAGGAGGMLSVTAPGVAGIKAGAVGAKEAFLRMAANPKRIASLEANAVANQAQAMKPTTLETQAVTQSVAPELLKRGVKGTGWKIDRTVLERQGQAGEAVRAAEARLLQEARPEFQIGKAPILSKIDQAIEQLNVRGTGKAVEPGAVAKLKELREVVDALPDYADFEQIIDLRRKLDDAVERGGGFKQAGTAADRINMQMTRGVADLVRAELNRLDDGLKAANREYTVYSRAAEVVKRRQLGEVGKIGSGLPGRGSILDDLLVTWAGEAAGGPIGGAIAEGINLGMQTRAVASMKASARQTFADALRKRLPAKPQQKLLAAGSRPMPAPETSAVTAIPIPPASTQFYTPKTIMDTIKRIQMWYDLDPTKAPKGQLDLNIPRTPALTPKQALKLWKEANPKLPAEQIELFLDQQTTPGAGVATPDNPKLGFRGTVRLADTGRRP